MTPEIPNRTKRIEEVPMDELSNLVVVNDTGSKLNFFPDAKTAYTDHTGKEYTAYIVDADGEEHTIYCGNIVYAGDPTNDAPSPSDIIDQHSRFDNDGEREWGRIL